MNLWTILLFSICRTSSGILWFLSFILTFHIPIYWLFSYLSLHSSFSDHTKYYIIHIDLLESRINWRVCYLPHNVRVFTHSWPLVLLFLWTSFQKYSKPHRTFYLTLYYTDYPHIRLPSYLPFLYLFIPSYVFMFSSQLIFLSTPLSISFSVSLMVTHSSKCCLSKNISFSFSF